MLSNSNELIGKALGKCTLQRLLGRGGMGAVYLAQQSRPRRIVAVKVLLPDLVLEPRPRDEFLARFRREADAIAALDHVNIMPIYEYGEQGDTAYLVMPYITGGTLREKLDQRGKLPLKEALYIIEQVAAGLDSAHAKGIVHRDLKPGNILFHADGRVLIADFGLAKVLKDVTDQESHGHFLTSAGTIVGTPEYLSPEQGTGNPLDHRTDVYSLGIVLFHMLAGRVPFFGTSPVAVAIKHALEVPPSLTQLNPTVPPAVEAVVHQAMAKSPDQRYNSAGELAHALRSAITTNLDGYKVPAEELDSKQETLILPANNNTELDLSDEKSAEPENTATKQSPTTDDPQHVSKLDASPALLIGSDTDDLHASTTEATPRLPAKIEAVTSMSTVISDAKTTVNRSPEAPHPQHLKQMLVAQTTPTNPPPARAGCQSASMMLIGSILTLLIIAGGFAAYLHWTPPLSKAGQTHVNGTPQVQRTPINSTPSATQNATVPVHSQIPTGIPAPIVDPYSGQNIGAMLYGTSLPGPGCDQQGGKWSITQNAKITCGTATTELINTGTMPGNLAGTFLDTLPNNGQMPNNFILQVQVDITSPPQGSFGVYFRNQPGSQQGAYSFLIHPATESWEAFNYKNTTGDPNHIASHALQSKVEGTLTIEIVVHNNDFAFYINGLREGNATSGGQYLSGTIGLAADLSTAIAFKNLTIYALN